MCQIIRSMPNAGSTTWGINHSPVTRSVLWTLFTCSSSIVIIRPSISTTQGKSCSAGNCSTLVLTFPASSLKAGPATAPSIVHPSMITSLGELNSRLDAVTCLYNFHETLNHNSLDEQYQHIPPIRMNQISQHPSSQLHSVPFL